MTGKFIWCGMSAKDALDKVIASDRYEYIASGNGWFWLKTRYDDVVEVVSDANGIVTDIDFL